MARLLFAIGLALSGLQVRPAPVATPGPDGPPLLVILAPTGIDRDGLPVYTTHQNHAAYEDVLSHGFSGRLLRLYRWEQEFRARRSGKAIEPAYLLLSQHEGGFPRFGFWLDAVRKDDVGYVDLQERMDGSGRFGALDQIFPHELVHVIVRQLAGVPPPGTSGANQVHAIGVQTDRVTAFDEGFAEHAQVMAIDDPDARPGTAALRGNEQLVAGADDRLRRYRRALEARWAPAPAARMGFILWFSQTEQVLRYHAVKADRFAREPRVPIRGLGTGDLYAAYLLENVLPGEDDAPFKSTPRLLSSEGVIACLFSRWVADPVMQQAGPVTLYARFGLSPDVDAAGVAPMDRAYLKLFTVLADDRPHDAGALIRGYVATFPDEADAVSALVRRTGFAWPLPDVPEIWLANDTIMTGTTLFDQYRAMPRVHTFDLNAASTVDLLTVDGVSRDLAAAIEHAGPYASLADLDRVPGMTPVLVGRFRAMAQAMTAVRDANARQDIESLDFARLLRPVLVRAAVWMLVCAVGAAWSYGRVRPLRVWRLTINGLAAAALSVVPVWALGTALRIGDRPVPSEWFLLLPILGFGLPGALWQLVRRRPIREAGRVIAAWALATVPAVLITVPLF